MSEMLISSGSLSNISLVKVKGNMILGINPLVKHLQGAELGLIQMGLKLEGKKVRKVEQGDAIT